MQARFKRGEYYCYRDIRDFTGLYTCVLNKIIERLGIQSTYEGPRLRLFTREDTKRILREVLREKGELAQKRLGRMSRDEVVALIQESREKVPADLEPES